MPPGRVALIRRVECITERTADARLDLLLAVDRQLVVEVKGEDPQVVQPEQVVGVSVSVDHRMDDADPLANQLGPQLRWRVDQQIASGKPHDGRTAGSAIFGVAAGASSAPAPDQRGTGGWSRPPGPEQA